jgi:hypothetical protein
VDVGEFRDDFPAFADASVWPDDFVGRVIARSVNYFDIARWGVWLEDGQGNWVAHELATNPPEETGTTAGTAQTDGDVSTKRVGSVSVSRDAGRLKAVADNPYQATKYGRKYLWLAKMAGVGAVVAGSPGIPILAPL